MAPRGRVWIGALAVVFALLVVVLAPSLPVTGPAALSPARTSVPGTPTGPVAVSLPAAVALHWGRPGPLIPATLGEPSPAASPLPRAAAPFCDPYPGFTGDAGVNFSVATTPSNGSGAAPLPFAWSVQIGGGGLPPYRIVGSIFGPTGGVAPYSNMTSFNASSGNLTLSIPGTYLIDVWVGDSSCTQSSGVQITEFAWGALGPHPLTVSASATRGVAPFNVTLNSTLGRALPANWSVSWNALLGPANGSALFGLSTQVNHTFLFPGAYELQACLHESPNSTEYFGSYWLSLYACAPPMNLTVTGSPPFSVGFARGAGAFPVNVTFWINRTAEWLPTPPAGQTVQTGASVWDGTTTLGGTFGENASTVLNGTNVTCGPNWGVFFDPMGVCALDVRVALVLSGSANSTAPWLDGGWLGQEDVFFNLTSNVTPAQWVPTVTATFSAVNGSAPLNLTLNLSFSGGRGPYAYGFAVFGHAAPPNLTFYPTESRGSNAWNGSAVSFLLPLNQDGEYFASAAAQDLAGHYFTFEAPLIVLSGNASGAAALRVGPSENLTLARLPGASTVTFEVTVSGGVGPYGIQWDFGDGSYGSSLPGEPVLHRYLAPGTYTPTVTVSAGGISVVRPLAPITVEGPGLLPTNASNLSSGAAAGSFGPAGTASLELAAGAVAGCAAVLLLTALAYRREVRRQGKELLGWVPETSSESMPR